MNLKIIPYFNLKIILKLSMLKFFLNILLIKLIISILEDEIEYIIEGMEINNSLSIRRQSTFNLIKVFN